MSGTVEELIQKLKNLPAFIKAVGTKGIDDNSQEILDLNKAQMLVAGVDADGKDLGDYAPLSIEIRQEAGLQTDHIDLRFTGEFQDSMILKKEGDKRAIDATDPKWDGNALVRSLSQQWPAALGLTDESEEAVTKKLTDTINSETDKYLSSSVSPKVNVKV